MADRLIRLQALEIVRLQCDKKYEEALTLATALARANPGSALAHNLAGNFHVRASTAAEGPPGDEEDASRHRRAAVDSFSAAARVAPNCVMSGFLHAEALAADQQFSGAMLELFRVTSTPATKQDDPVVHHVAYDLLVATNAKARKEDAVYKASVLMQDLAARINNEIVPPEAVKLLEGDASVGQVQARAKLLSEMYPYSVRAQLLRVHIDLEQVSATDQAVRRKGLLRRILALISHVADKFESSLLVALFHAKVLFALDEFDKSESECRRALRIEEPTDPNFEDMPPAISVPGADYESRVSSVKKQVRVLLKRIIVVAAECWSSIKSTQHGERVDMVISVRVDTLQGHYAGIDQAAAKTIADALRFLKNQSSWSFLICPNPRCHGKKFVNTESLWQHMSSKHRDELWEKLQSVLGQDINENASKDDHSLDGITLCEDSGQHDIFQLPGVQPIFESLLLSPSIGIRAEPLAEMRQRKCREGAEILEDIKKKLKMLPDHALSTEGSCFAIQDLWLKFLQTSALDHREVILPLARSFQWIKMKESIALSAKHLGGIIGHAYIDTIFGTSGESVKEIASTSSSQQSLNDFNKNNADKELSILSLIIRSLCNLRHFRDKVLTAPLVWIPSFDNPCIAQKFYEIFSSWEKNDHQLTDGVLTYMKTLLCGIINCTTFYEKAGTNFASEIVAAILSGLHISESCSRCSLNMETEKHVLNPIMCGDCTCPTDTLFGIKFSAQMSCQCGECSGEYVYTALFHKLDAGSPQTTKIQSFAELPVLLDEQFYKDNNCKDCGTLQNNDLFLLNTPHFFTIVLNWLGESESQDTLSEVLAGTTSPLDTGFFCKSANSSAMYTVTSLICYADERYVCFARDDEGKWLIYDFETVEKEDTWEHLLERFKDCKLKPEVLFFEVIK